MPFSDDLIATYSAVNDGQWSKQAFTITAGSKNLHSPVPLWGAGDHLKTIVAGNAGGPGPQGGSPLISTIDTVTDSQNIVLHDAAVMTLPLVDTSRTNFIVSWGTDNSAAFTALKTARAGAIGTLSIPAGKYLVANGNLAMFGGIKGLTVNAANAAADATTICGGTFSLGADSQLTGPNDTARVAAVSAGATSITCLTPAFASRFTVGQWALMTGVSTQWAGYPSNHFIYEYVLVSAVNAVTGEVTFATTPLKYSYKTTWPDILPTGLDYGGPATLYVLDPTVFDFTCVLNGLSVANDAQFAYGGLNIAGNNCHFYGDFSVYATMARGANFTNCVSTGDMEVDKYITNFNMTGCTWGAGITCQSSDETLILDSTTVPFTLSGTVKNTIIRNGCSIGTLSPGATYGYNTSLIVTDSIVSNFSGTFLGHTFAGGDNGADNGVNNDFTMANGIITVPNSWIAVGYVTQWMIPGNVIHWIDANVGSIGIFKILDVTQDATNCYVYTDWTGGFPTDVRSVNNNKLHMVVHPAQSCIFRNVTGCPEVVDLSGAPAGLPLFSYSKRPFTGSVAADSYWQLQGKIKKIVVNVTTPYTGGDVGAVQATLQNNVINAARNSLADVSFSPVINLKIAGERALDCSNGFIGNWTGAQSGDTLPNITTPLWSCGNYRRTMTDISGEASGTWPAGTIEYITDQGFQQAARTLLCKLV